MKFLKYLIIMTTALSLTSCGNKSNDETVWDATAMRFKKLRNPKWSGKENPRMLQDESELLGPIEDEFIALQDDDLHIAHIDDALPQPVLTPGEPGSGLPSLSNYNKPKSPLFENINFDTDRHSIRSETERERLRLVAAHMKKNKSVYLSVEGHCDQRGPEQYNQALGTRRANSVRRELVTLGVNPNNIHTVSFGKEKPLDHNNNPEAWAKNRRVEFKIHKKD